MNATLRIGTEHICSVGVYMNRFLNCQWNATFSVKLRKTRAGSFLFKLAKARPALCDLPPNATPPLRNWRSVPFTVLPSLENTNYFHIYLFTIITLMCSLYTIGNQFPFETFIAQLNGFTTNGLWSSQYNKLKCSPHTTPWSDQQKCTSMWRWGQL